MQEVEPGPQLFQQRCGALVHVVLSLVVVAVGQGDRGVRSLRANEFWRASFTGGGQRAVLGMTDERKIECFERGSRGAGAFRDP